MKKLFILLFDQLETDSSVFTVSLVACEQRTEQLT